MNSIQDVLREELEYELKMLEQYRRVVDDLPRGSLWKKIVNSRVYYYLAYREGRKVKFDYIGKLSDENLKAMREKIGKRKRYKILIKDLNKEIKYLKKLLNVK